MSKLVLFLFLGVCVMAVHMVPANDGENDEISDEALEALVDSLEPKIKEEFLEQDPRINWKKVWSKAKPILKDIGKVAKPIVTEAAKAAAAAAPSGAVRPGK